MKTFLLAICLIVGASLQVFASAPLHITMTTDKLTSLGQAVGFDLADPGGEAAVTHIFNLQGEEVSELTAQSLSRFSWDGTDVDRQPVESGLYVAQIRHHGEVWHGPIVVNH